MVPMLCLVCLDLLVWHNIVTFRNGVIKDAVKQKRFCDLHQGSIRDNLLPVFKEMDPEMFTMIGWDPPGYGKSRPPARKFLNAEGDVHRTDAHLVAKMMEVS